MDNVENCGSYLITVFETACYLRLCLRFHNTQIYFC
jgi:hypothetical protein